MTKTTTETKIEQLLDEAYEGFAYAMAHAETIGKKIESTLYGKRVRVVLADNNGFFFIHHDRLGKTNGLSSTKTAIVNVASMWNSILHLIEVRDIRDYFIDEELVSNEELDALADDVETYSNGIRRCALEQEVARLLRENPDVTHYCHGREFTAENVSRQLRSYFWERYDNRVIVD